MVRMAEVVLGSKFRNLQQILVHSKWDARAIIAHVAREASEYVGDDQPTGFLIGESGFDKREPDLVGGPRQ